MPADLTWWEAAKFARAGVPVRRESVTDPLAWFSYDLPGLFYRYEETNSTLGGGAVVGVATHIVVKASQFTATEFNATDWTTYGVPAGADVDPLPIDEPPSGGVPPGYPPQPPGKPPVEPPWKPPLPPRPPFDPPPSSGAPHWEDLGTSISGTDPLILHVTGTLAGVSADTSWSCVARWSDGGGVPHALSMGTATGPGDVDMEGEGSPFPFNTEITVSATCASGPSTLIGSTVVGLTRTLSD